VNAAVVIPARMGSTRLPGKVLEDIDGVPLLVHVMRRAEAATQVARVIVATDDARIADLVERHDGEARMTRLDHQTGTDRVAEVAAGLEDDLIVNVQGDNLDLDPSVIDAVVAGLRQTHRQVVTPVVRFPEEHDVADASKVKVVLAQDGRAVYFSRQPVPSGGPWWLHIGVYGFHAATLQEFARLPQSKLECAEGLEQLRLIEHGIEIDTVRVARPATSIDTPHDLASARSLHSSSTLRH